MNKNNNLRQREEEDEIQLHEEEEGMPMVRKRHRSNEAKQKLEAIDWARKNSVNSAAKKFRIDRKSVREWMKQEKKLIQQVSTPAGGTRKRLDGCGRAVSYPQIDIALAGWIREMRANKNPVSRRIIRDKANEFFINTEIKVIEFFIFFLTTPN